MQQNVSFRHLNHFKYHKYLKSHMLYKYLIRNHKKIFSRNFVNGNYIVPGNRFLWLFHFLPKQINGYCFPPQNIHKLFISNKAGASILLIYQVQTLFKFIQEFINTHKNFCSFGCLLPSLLISTITFINNLAGIIASIF